MTKKISPKLCTGLILLAGILWGSMGLFVRKLNSIGFSSIQVASLRLCFTAVILVALILITDKSKLKIKLRDLPFFLCIGLGSILFFTICYFTAIRLASLAAAAILLYTAPIFVVLLSAIFLHEKLTAKKTVCLALAFVGCVLVSRIGSSSSISPLGLLTGLGAGFGYGLYSIFGSILLKKYHPFTVTVYAFIISGIGSLFICNLGEIVTIANGFNNYPLLLIIVLCTALITAVIPFAAYTLGLSGTQAGKASIMASIEPAVAAIIGVLVFSEPLSLQAALGILLVLIAIISLNVTKKHKG